MSIENFDSVKCRISPFLMGKWRQHSAITQCCTIVRAACDWLMTVVCIQTKFACFAGSLRAGLSPLKPLNVIISWITSGLWPGFSFGGGYSCLSLPSRVLPLPSPPSPLVPSSPSLPSPPALPSFLSPPFPVIQPARGSGERRCSPADKLFWRI